MNTDPRVADVVDRFEQSAEPFRESAKLKPEAKSKNRQK